MKRILASILVFILMLGSILGAASADAVRDDSAAFGVDMVIVLDMTNSMQQPNDAKKGNDIYGFRKDATAMLIGMLDMDRSRVAIVAFAGSPMEAKDINLSELRTVSDQESRDKLLAAIYSIGNKPRTNLGAALMKANQILDSREDKTNLPAIILMTDGNNDMSSPEADFENVNDSWRWEDGQIVNKGTEKYTTDLANKVTREAVACASELGFPIYTVSLTQDPDEAKNGGMSLRAIAQGTGLENGCWYVENKDSAKDLPGFFAEVLADKIGSSVQNHAKPEKVEGEANTYQVTIPVLNKSVLETNIIIPTKSSKGSISSIDPNSIKILNADGVPQTEFMGVSVMREKTQGHFALVKIRQPRTTGLWKLQFTSTNPPDDIIFNILYNYDIQLTATATVSGPDPQDFYKNDVITLRSNFVDGAGNASTDPDLYTDHSGDAAYEDWMIMKARWELYPLNASGQLSAEPVKTGELSLDSFRYLYEGQVDLHEERLLSGNYHLIVYVNGAGLSRKVTIPVYLKNREPVGSDYLKPIVANRTNDRADPEGSWTVRGTSGTMDLKAGEIITERDNDTLSFNLVPEDNVEQAATMELLDDGTIAFTTQPADGGEGIKDGSAVYRLYYSDGDNGEGSVQISLNIMSEFVEKLLKKYDPELTVTDGQGAAVTEFKKNSPLFVAVRLKDKEGTGYAGAEELEMFGLGCRLTITNTLDEENPEPIISNMNMEMQGDAYAYEIDTGNKQAKWEISAEVDFYENPVTATVTIPNKGGPEIVQELLAKQEEPLTLYCDGERAAAIPLIGGLFSTDTAEEDPARDICTTAMFKDGDNDRLLVYDPVFMNPATGERMDHKAISAVEKEAEEGSEEKHYLVNFDGESTGLFRFSFDAVMNVTAEDGDGLTATFTRKVTVVDQYNKMLTILVAAGILIVAVTVLCLIIHQVRKPVFPKLNVAVSEGTSLYDSATEELSPTKQATNANAMGVDGDMADRHHIALALLQRIIIFPIRSRNGVGVVIKAKLEGHVVMLRDQPLKSKKKYTWNKGEELVIQHPSGDGPVILKLEDRPAEDFSDVTGGFGEEGDWSSDSGSSDSGSSGKKHSRKVKRGETPKAEETASGGGSDDFDF